MSANKSRAKSEFGDFQTSASVAERICTWLAQTGVRPTAVLEPTCGTGSFLAAAAKVFCDAQALVGFEINPSYVRQAAAIIRPFSPSQSIEIVRGDFFTVDWPNILATLPDPLLVIGNPPWVTNSELSKLGSSNLPEMANFQRRAGLEALTGKSNFDISEWMLTKLAELLQTRTAVLAMICKTAVARRTLSHIWQRRLPFQGASIHRIDAEKTFGAAVDACVLTIHFGTEGNARDCLVYDSLDDGQHRQKIGFPNGRLCADVSAYEELQHLHGLDSYRWRSGIKHDCTKVMEFLKEGGRYRNGLNELVELEDEFLYPTLKTSEVAGGKTREPRRWVIITQKSVGEETSLIRERAPKTWEYLQRHAEALSRRASSIYRKRPPFSIFGVGSYSFASWKVAISGFYKRLQFTEIGPFQGKPIMLDDATYFLPCRSKQHAHRLAKVLESELAKRFLKAFIFWDAKRPVTAEVLEQLNLDQLLEQQAGFSPRLF